MERCEVTVCSESVCSVLGCCCNGVASNCRTELFKCWWCWWWWWYSSSEPKWSGSKRRLIPRSFWSCSSCLLIDTVSTRPQVLLLHQERLLNDATMIRDNLVNNESNGQLGWAVVKSWWYTIVGWNERKQPHETRTNNHRCDTRDEDQQ